MLPLSLLNATIGHAMMVEIKNGETFNGHLTACDNWMNVTLKDAVQTSADGERFWKMQDVYIRGNTIKYLRVEDEIIDRVREEADKFRQQNRARGGGGRGGGRGGRGGGPQGRGGGHYTGGTGRGGFRARGRGQ